MTADSDETNSPVLMKADESSEEQLLLKQLTEESTVTATAEEIAAGSHEDHKAHDKHVVFGETTVIGHALPVTNPILDMAENFTEDQIRNFMRLSLSKSKGQSM
jgi:hypothetical protein